MKYDKPPIIPVPGINIKSCKIDAEGNIDQLNLAINLEQLIDGLKNYTDARGWANTQIVKRRTPSPKGHTHLMRIASKLNDANKASNEIEEAA